MKILSFTCAQCLWRLRWAGAISVSLVVAVLLAWPVPPGMGLEAGRTAALWLHAPAFLLTAAALATAVDVWPLFARGRSGAEVVDRIQPGILSGCGMASAGALAALALWLAAMGAVFASLLMALSSPPDLKTHYRLVPDREFLDAQNQELRAAGPSGVPIDTIELRPRSILPRVDAFATTRVQIFADGESLHTGYVDLGGQLEDHRVTFPPRAIEQLQIRRAQGTGPPLLFGGDSIRAVGAASHSWILGCIVAALAYLLPASLALSLACLLRSHLAMPIVVVGMLAVLTVTTLSHLVPGSEAVTALARGSWFLGEEPVRKIAPSLSAAGLVIMLAMATRARGYR